MHLSTPAKSIFDGPITNLLSVLCILTEVLSGVHAKGGVGCGGLNDLQFFVSLVVFQVTARQAWK